MVWCSVIKMNYLFMFLFIGYSYRVLSSHIDEAVLPKADDSYQDDNYDYGDDSELDTEVVSNEINGIRATETTTPLPPYFAQAEIEILAKPGEDVLLPCDVRNFRLGNVIVWYRDGEEVIATGQYANNHRYVVLRNYSIHLMSAHEADAGNYFCEVHPERIRQKVSLRIGRSLSIYCDGRDVTDRTITLREGGQHVLECRTVPESTNIKWSLNGERAELLATKIEAGRLYIDRIDAEFSGIYQCLGDDGTHNPPHGMVLVDVQYAPKVSTHRHHVNTEVGDSADLYCDYKANPVATVHWLKDGRIVRISEDYIIRNMPEKKHNRTILTINNVAAYDLGQYDCYVENTIGSNIVKVHLSYAPEIPQFEDLTIEGNLVTLHWLVRSKQPLTEAVMDYKMTGAYSWSTVSSLRTKNHDKEALWKLTHQMELMPGEWHVRVKTRNTVDWSKFSAQHDFIINDMDEMSRNADGNIPADDLVQAAGIWKSNNTAGLSISTISCTFILSVSVLLQYMCH